MFCEFAKSAQQVGIVYLESGFSCIHNIDSFNTWVTPPPPPARGGGWMGGFSRVGGWVKTHAPPGGCAVGLFAGFVRFWLDLGWVGRLWVGAWVSALGKQCPPVEVEVSILTDNCHCQAKRGKFLFWGLPFTFTQFAL